MADEAKARGNAAFSAGNFAEAITHFTVAIELSPTNHILYSNRSAAYASLSNFTQALIDAEKTVELKPDWSKAYSRLGAAHIGLKNYPQAVSSYENGLKIDPTNAVLRSGLSDANYALANAGYSQKQLELINDFNATKPIDELLKTYDEMEACFDDKVYLIAECLKLKKALHGVNRHEDAGLFLQKVNKIMLGGKEDDNCPGCSLASNSSFDNAKVCNLMGSTCFDAKDYAASFTYLSIANEILTRLEQDESFRCASNCLLKAIEFNHYKLHKVCLFTHKLEEAADYGKKHLEVKEKLFGGDCIEIVLANMDVFFAYGGALKCRDAIPYGLKALEIQEKCLGSDSVEAANMRFNLSFMYHELGEHDKALELEELSNNVLNVKARDSPDMMLKEGRYEEAIGVLEGELSRADIREDERAMNTLGIADAFFELGKFPDAKKHLRTAEEMLKNYPGLYNHNLVAVLFVKMSEVYEKMDDTEAAVSLIKRVLAIPDISQDLLSRTTERLFLLVSKSGKVSEEIPDLLDAVEKLKVSFGLEHCEVGYGYGLLGGAYWNSGQQELGAKFVSDAKRILDATIGPNHLSSLKTSHKLSKFYGNMGRFAQALEIEKKVVEGLKGLDPSELGFMHEVNTHLNKMKERVAESPITASSQSSDGGPSAKISKPDISDDGKST